MSNSNWPKSEHRNPQVSQPVAKKATTFADYGDLIGYIKARDSGKSQMESFNFGDNGIGKWGAITANDRTPMFALPPEVWIARLDEIGSLPKGFKHRYLMGTDKHINLTMISRKAHDEPTLARFHAELQDFKLGSANGLRGYVVFNGKRVEGTLRDTMPHEKNITNGAEIDLNPAFCREFGVFPPASLNVQFCWID